MNQHKSMLLTAAMILVCLLTKAQEITGKIIDEQTGESLVGVNVSYPNSTVGTVSDLSGTFTLGEGGGDSLQISFIGYATKTVPAQANMGIISMTQNNVALNQVVVTGSRNAQKRTDVPVAMSMINPKTINQTKATSTDQLVNKTPGVYMTDLGNEQHAMAIRQPLGFKSLFLYLEDGVPIRTTGLFNHNALLEMNMSAFRNIEIIRGPASSIYGSEAIGGAINFITLKPTPQLNTRIAIQGNNLGFKRGDLLFSNTYGKVGVLFTGNYAFRTNGYRAHSDYEKLSLTGKVNYRFNDKMNLENAVTLIDYRSDMTGSLDSANFYDKEYASLQTFTNRDVIALRYRSSLNYYWKKGTKTTATVFFRNNSIKQNPSYRIKDDFSPWANPNGNRNLAHSEVNDNSFKSYGAIVQHRQQLNFFKAAVTTGLSVDYSPSTYMANYISIYKTNEGIYERFEKSDSVLTDYSTDFLNRAGYIQAEFNPTKKLKVTAALRYDHFRYDYDNNLDSTAFSGAPDAINTFGTASPKIGANYTLKDGTGFYANYSRGFVPPQVSELYRGVKVPGLEPAIFENMEVGALFTTQNGKASFDLAAYQLNGLNEIISVRLDNGDLVNQNAGKTSHRGIEYGIRYQPVGEVTIRISATHARHTFTNYVEQGNDFTEKDMAMAPNTIANSEIVYEPKKIKGLRIGLEWQHMDEYYMDNANTKKYEGFNIFHMRFGYAFKGFETWLNVMNVGNTLYATSARKSAWGTNYNPGDPRNFNIGLAYKFNKK